MVDLLLSWNPNSTESPRTTAVRGECQEGSTALTWANEQSVSLKFKKGLSRGPWWNPLSAISKRSLIHRAGRERGSLTWRQLHSRAAPGSGGLGRGGLQHQRHLRSIKETGAARLEPGTQCTATAEVQSTYKTTFSILEHFILVRSSDVQPTVENNGAGPGTQRTAAQCPIHWRRIWPLGAISSQCQQMLSFNIFFWNLPFDNLGIHLLLKLLSFQ